MLDTKFKLKAHKKKISKRVITITDLNSKPLTPSDLRESFSSIYRYDNVVNVNSTLRNPSSRSLSDILLQLLQGNLYPYQVEHTDKSKRRKKG